MKKLLYLLVFCLISSAMAEKKSLVIIATEDEYRTDITLPRFAEQVLSKDFKIDFVTSSSEERNYFPGLEKIKTADLVILSLHRRALSKEQMKIFKDYLRSGKPLVAIRTSTHGFALRANQTAPEDSVQWQEFDREVLGCKYTGHYHAVDGAEQISAASLPIEMEATRWQRHSRPEL